MLKRHIRFIPRGRVHLNNLDRDIAMAMGWKRHASADDKGCFCGINMVTDGDQKAIQIVWTEDGENGYIKELTPEEESIIMGVLNSQGRGRNG